MAKPTQIVEIARVDPEDTEPQQAEALDDELHSPDEVPYLIAIRGNTPSRLFKLEKAQTLIGRSGNADISLSDSGISREHCVIIRQPDGGVRLKDLASSNGTFHKGERITEVTLREGDKFQLGPGTIFKLTYEEILKEEFQEALYEAAIKDTLTQVYNKRVLLEQLRLEFVYYRRFRRPLSLCLMDVDHFRQVNETWGHQAGDRLLAAVARFIAATTRASDVFARYGGEEFAIILRETDRGQAEIFAGRILKAMEAARFGLTDRDGEEQPVRLTLSLGIATLQDENYATPMEMVAEATRALLGAKGRGRNCFVALP